MMVTSKETKNRIWRLNFFRLGFFLIIFSSLIASLFIIKGLFITLLLAFVISFLLLPIVNFLNNRGMPRGAATGLTFFCILSFLTIGVSSLLPFLSQQFATLKKEFPLYISKSTQMIKTWQEQLETHLTFLQDANFAAHLEKYLSSFSQALLEDLPSTLTQSFTILLLAPLFAFFITKNEFGLLRNIYPLVPNQFFEMFLGLHYKISKQIGVFIRGRLLEAFVIGLLVGAVLFFFKVPFALPLTVFAGFANLVPYVGPVVASLAIFLVTLINGFDTAQIASIIILFYSIQVVDTFVVVPLLLARLVNLHPLTVIIIIIAGAQFMGILGMIISIPLANALKISVMSIYQHISNNI